MSAGRKDQGRFICVDRTGAWLRGRQPIFPVGRYGVPDRRTRRRRRRPPGTSWSRAVARRGLAGLACLACPQSGQAVLEAMAIVYKRSNLSAKATASVSRKRGVTAESSCSGLQRYQGHVSTSDK
jgi:hypothetical protein